MLGAFLFGSWGTLNPFRGWFGRFGRKVWGCRFSCRVVLLGVWPFGLLGLILRLRPRCLRCCLFRVQCTCWPRIVIGLGGLRFVFRLGRVFQRWILPWWLLQLAGLFLLRLRKVVSSFAPITFIFGGNLFKYAACHRLWRASRRRATKTKFLYQAAYSFVRQTHAERRKTKWEMSYHQSETASTTKTYPECSVHWMQNAEIAHQPLH